MCSKLKHTHLVNHQVSFDDQDFTKFSSESELVLFFPCSAALYHLQGAVNKTSGTSLLHMRTAANLCVSVMPEMTVFVVRDPGTF